MEPTAPPYHSIQLSSNLRSESVCGNQLKSNRIDQIISENLGNDKKDCFSERINLESKDKRVKSYSQVESSTAQPGFCSGVSKETITIPSKNKCQPYSNCHKQLTEMDQSLSAPSYENVARFHEQQRQIASELEANRCFNAKGNAGSSSHTCCFQSRNSHLNNVRNVDPDLSCSDVSCENQNSRISNKTTMVGKLIHLHICFSSLFHLIGRCLYTNT